MAKALTMESCYGVQKLIRCKWKTFLQCNSTPSEKAFQLTAFSTLAVTEEKSVLTQLTMEPYSGHSMTQAQHSTTQEYLGEINHYTPLPLQTELSTLLLENTHLTHRYTRETDTSPLTLSQERKYGNYSDGLLQGYGQLLHQLLLPTD